MQYMTDENGRKYVQDFYIYNTPVITSLAAAAASTVIIPIEADSSFTVLKTSYFADIAGAVQTDSTRVLPLVTIAISDSGSGRNLQNSATPINTYGGHDGLPMVWPVPREFKASSSISITFTNFSDATTYADLRLSLIGIKKFYMS